MKKYIDECGYFPRHITWKENTAATMGYCKLLHVVDKVKVYQYLHTHVNNIITTGDSQGYRYSQGYRDSQGYRYSQAFILILSRIGKTCQLSKKESVGFTISSSYFHRAEDSAHKAAVNAPTRTCHS